MASQDDTNFRRILTRYWVRFLEDGVSCETQFDYRTGEQRPWDPAPERLRRVMWAPFDAQLAQIVSNRGEEVLAIEGMPPIIIDLDPNQPWFEIEPSRSMFWGAAGSWAAQGGVGERAICKLVGKVDLTDYYHCVGCGQDMFWDGTGTLECPRCGARNEWYCSRCKDLKTDPLFMEKGEVRCRDCADQGEPHGLMRVKNLELRSFAEYETIYVLGVEGKTEVWFGESEIRIKH